MLKKRDLAVAFHSAKERRRMKDTLQDRHDTKRNSKDVHLAELSSELEQWKRAREQLSERVRDETGQPGTRQREDLDDLTRRYEKAKYELNAAEKSPAKSWVDSKSRVDQAFGSLREAGHRLGLSKREKPTPARF